MFRIIDNFFVGGIKSVIFVKKRKVLKQQEEIELSKRSILKIAVIVVLAVFIIGSIYYISSINKKAEQAVNGFDGFDIKTEIIQKNNLTVMHSVLIIPDGISMNDGFTVKVTRVRNAYVNIPPGTLFAKNPDLFLGNKADLVFTKNEGYWENYVTVPNGMLLDVEYKIWFTEKKIWIIHFTTDTYINKRVST